MTKVVSILFHKMFQTNSDISTKEKYITITIAFFLAVVVMGYFMVG